MGSVASRCGRAHGSDCQGLFLLSLSLFFWRGVSHHALCPPPPTCKMLHATNSMHLLLFRHQPVSCQGQHQKQHRQSHRPVSYWWSNRSSESARLRIGVSLSPPCPSLSLCLRFFLCSLSLSIVQVSCASSQSNPSLKRSGTVLEFDLLCNQAASIRVCWVSLLALWGGVLFLLWLS